MTTITNLNLNQAPINSNSASSGPILVNTANDAAAKAAQGVVTQLLSTAADQSNSSSTNSDGNNNANFLSAPVLTLPSASSRTAQADFTSILRSMQSVLSTASQNNAQANANVYSSHYTAQQARANALGNQINAASSLATDAQNMLQNPSAQLPQPDPSFSDVPGYASSFAQLISYGQALQAAYNNLQEAESAYQQDPSSANQAALNTAQAAYAAAQSPILSYAQKQMQAASDLTTQLIQTGVADDGFALGLLKRQGTALSGLVQLIETIAAELAQEAKQKLSVDERLFKELQAANQKQQEEQAKKIQQQIQQAQQMQQIMGCVGQILGGLLTVIGAVVSIATAATGVGVAIGIGIAAVGLALITTDAIMQATGHETLTNMIMKPFMDVIQPILNFLISSFAKFFEHLGISQATAQILGDVMVGVYAAALIIAAIVISRNGEVLANLGSQIAEKIIPNFIKTIAQKMVQAALWLAEKFGLNEATNFGENALAQRLASLAKIAGKAVIVGESAVNVAGNIVIGMSEKEQKDAEALFVLIQAIEKMLMALLHQAIKNFGDAQKMVEKLVEGMSSALQANQQAGNLVAANISGKAA